MPLILAAALAFLPSTVSAKAPRPDVVLIVIDTLRADHLGCYGYRRPTSPRIDDLARNGVVFENALAQANWTLPSVASLMTSLYPSEHGALLFPDSPPQAKGLTDQATLASILRERGYHTAAFTCGPFLRAGFGLDRGFSEYVHGTQNAAGFNRLLLPWLERHRRAPFFLYVHLQDVHSPYGKNDREAAKWGRGYAGPADGSTEYLEKAARGEVIPSEEDMRHIVSLYDSDIASVDRHLGALLDKLKELGLLEHTIVVITSDHGESFREHGGKMFHGTSPYDEELRVPLIARGPGLQRGKAAAPVQLVDVLPTVLGLLGIPVPRQAKGRSLLPLVARPVAPPGAVFSEPSGNGGRDHRAPISYQVAREGLWKLIHPLDGGADELYDLSADPGERSNEAARRPQAAARLRSLLSRWKIVAADANAGRAQAKEDPQVRDERERGGLGYRRGD